MSRLDAHCLEMNVDIYIWYTCQLSRIMRDSPAWEPKYRLSRMRDENLPHGEAFWIASIKQVTKVQVSSHQFKPEKDLLSRAKKATLASAKR